MALAEFNRGMILLRRGQRAQARKAFERAEATFSDDRLRFEIGLLDTYDDHAREVARQVWDMAERFPDHPVAA
jgi:hypothetical protein